MLKIGVGHAIESIRSMVRSNRFASGNLSKAILLFIAYLGIQFILQPLWLTSGGMWAENATVFYKTSADGFQLSDLLVLDSGYLPTFLHVITAILALPNLPATAMGYVLNWTGLVIAALPIIAFQMPIFRKLVAKDSRRSLVIIVILAFQSYWSTTNFLNSGYSMIFLLLVCGLFHTVSALKKDMPTGAERTRLPVWLLWLAPLLVFTKPAALSIIPLYFYLIFVLRGRERLGVTAVVAAGLTQVLVLATSRFQNRVFEQGTEFDFVSQTLNVFAYFIAFPFRVIAGPAWTDVLLGQWWAGNTVGQWWSQNNISLIFGGLILAGAVLLAWKSSNLVAKTWIWISLGMMLSASVLNNFTLWDIWNPSFYLYDAVPIHSRSLTMYVFTLCLFIGIAMVLLDRPFGMKSNWRMAKWVSRITPSALVITWMIGSGWAIYIPLFADEPRWPALGSSNWASSTLDGEGNFTEECILIEPWAWGVYGDGCRVVERSEHSEYSKSPLSSGLIGFASARTSFPDDFLSIVAFNIHAAPQSYVKYTLRISKTSGWEGLTVKGEVQTDQEGKTVVVNIPETIAINQIKQIDVSVDGALLFTKADGSSPQQILSFLVGRVG